MYRRELCLVAISDTHLGTYGCHATELLGYLRSVAPRILILNGDIIDLWEFKKHYFPAAHLNVIKEILKMASRGTRVYYVTGNHDDRLRRFTHAQLGNIQIRDKLELIVGGKKMLVFHGDVFDLSIQVTPLLARIGSRGYQLLILLNRWINNWRMHLGMRRISLAGGIKHSVKRAVRFIKDFEDMAIRFASEQGYDLVLCGHIHRPIIREVSDAPHPLTYLNAGDWVENLSALEFNGHEWRLHYHDPTDHVYANSRLDIQGTVMADEEEQLLPSEIRLDLDAILHASKTGTANCPG